VVAKSRVSKKQKFFHEEILKSAVSIVTKRAFDHLLYVGDMPLPSDIVKDKSVAKRKLIQAVTSATQCQVLEASGIKNLKIPDYRIPRQERFKMALVAGVSRGILKPGNVVLGIVGRESMTFPDTLMVMTIGVRDDDEFDTGFGVIDGDRVPSTIMESVLELAVDIAKDGWEGKPLGTIIVIGDEARVMEKSRQLTLNPFQGYSENEKNILNPEVRDAIKNFSVLDGAFIMRTDGVVLSAGRFLKFDDECSVDVPLGLGARHMAAAGISKITDAIAIVISETSGTVRVFQSGKCVLLVHSSHRVQHASPDIESLDLEADSLKSSNDRNSSERRKRSDVKKNSKSVKIKDTKRQQKKTHDK